MTLGRRAVLMWTGSAQFFWVPSRGFLLFIRQTKAILKRICEQPVSEVLLEKSSWKSYSHQKPRPQRREVLIMIRMKQEDHPFRREVQTGYSKFCQNSLCQKSWMTKTRIRSQQVKQVWQTVAFL